MFCYIIPLMASHEIPQPVESVTDGLTLEEDRELARLSSKWKGGRISTPVFTEIAKMTPQAIVEVVLLRVNDGQLETLLIPRPDDDIIWPGMVHTPGTALRLSDFLREDQNPLNGAFERLQGGELNSKFAYEPVFVGRLHRRTYVRGAEVAEIYMTELAEGSALQIGQVWYPVDKLIANPIFIQHQLSHVNLAAEHYRTVESKPTS